MYCAFIFLVIINFASCHWCHGQPFCQWKHRNYHHQGPRDWHHHRHGLETETPPNDLPTLKKNNFERISSTLINVDKQLKSFCEENGVQATEVYGSNYFLKYELPNYTEDQIKVKIKHRVIYTVADNGVKIFKDLRILPDILEVDSATWVLEHKVLKIVIPYKFELQRENVKNCETINETVIIVPKMKEYSTIQLREHKNSFNIVDFQPQE